MYMKQINLNQCYTVSPTGEIHSLLFNKSKLRKTHLSHKGYLVFRGLNSNGVIESFSVHRLVAKKYLPNFSNKLQVDHIDGNKLNNHYSNLRMVSNSKNQLNAVRLGKQPANQKRVGKFSLNGDLLQIYPNGKEASKSVGRNDQSNVLRCCRHIRPTAFKFIWEFV